MKLFKKHYIQFVRFDNDEMANTFLREHDGNLISYQASRDGSNIIIWYRI
jgi:hypothetical protein